jgi:hypothetical protein
MRAYLLAVLLAITAYTSCPAAGEADWFVPLGKPPDAPPKRISGGEAFPPLPLPATPLRRTERKRPPTPPSLFGKVVWGEQGSFTYEGGKTTQISDWNLCPADLQHLLHKVRDRFGLDYGYEDVSLPSFSGDPDKIRKASRNSVPTFSAAACSASIPSPARPISTTPPAR